VEVQRGGVDVACFREALEFSALTGDRVTNAEAAVGAVEDEEAVTGSLDLEATEVV
jgi:hypothetical protein